MTSISWFVETEMVEKQISESVAVIPESEEAHEIELEVEMDEIETA